MAESLREVLSFGRYEPLFRVAAGGMAEVYAARIQGEAGFQKLVAVKRMLPHLANESGFVDMFLNEAKLAAHIVSPHVVQTMDLGRGSEGSLYIVMELVVGISLARLLEAHPENLPLPVALELMAQATQGLDDAHEATTPAGDPLGLIHRDVSPHNILVGIDGRARVTDFGIARAVHAPRAETNIRELKGKFAYMSPEQTRLKTLDRRSDVFSTGVVLWEVLVGRRLFADRDPMEAIRHVQRRPVPPPSDLVPSVPEAVSAVAVRALERDPEKRFQTAAELAIAIRRAARESFGEPPHRKEIATFVEESGGEELQRLQRLIRLGTDGAAPETIEAVVPGITRVLSEDASGVAPLGTGARRTAVIGADGEVIQHESIEQTTAEITGAPVSMDTGTAMIISSEEMQETGLFESQPDLATEDRTDRVPVTPERTAPRTTAREVQLEHPEVSHSVPSRRAPSSGSRTITWTAVVAVGAALVLGVALAMFLFWPSDRPEAVLPVASDSPSDPHQRPSEVPQAAREITASTIQEAPDTASGNTPAREESADVPAVAPGERAGGATQSDSQAHTQAVEPRRGTHRQGRRTRRTRRRTPETSPSPPKPPSAPRARNPSAPLLGVQEFDRRTR